MKVVDALTLGFSSLTVLGLVVYLLRKFGYLDLKNFVCTFKGSNVMDDEGDIEVVCRSDERVSEIVEQLTLRIDKLERKLHDDFFDQTNKLHEILTEIRTESSESHFKIHDQVLRNGESTLRVEKILFKTQK